MIALDTNVLVRVLAADDPDQLRVALEVMRSGPLWLPKTVLLELEWVLRYSYEVDRARIADMVRKLLGLRQLEVEDRPAVIRALGNYQQGLDFADSLHLASSHVAEKLVTFDRVFVNRAARITEGEEGGPAVELLSISS